MEKREKVKARIRRKKRIRKKIQGTSGKPRLCVYKSLKHIYAQVIDDTKGIVITGVSSLNKEIKGTIPYGGNVDAAKKVGTFLGTRLKEMGITEVVFDRNGFKYHGRIKALADSAREAGLTF